MVDSILRDLFTGTIRPGDRIPGEAQLARKWNLSRNSVSDGLKKLDHLKVIEARRGGGITALDFRHHAGLPFLEAMVKQKPDGSLMMDLLDFKAALDPLLARLMARTAFGVRMSDILQLEALDSRVLAALDQEDLNTAVLAEEAYWRCIATLTGNLSTTLFLNSSFPVLRPLVHIQLNQSSGREFIHQRQRLFREASVQRQSLDYYEKKVSKILEAQLPLIKAQILILENQNKPILERRSV